MDIKNNRKKTTSSIQTVDVKVIAVEPKSATPPSRGQFKTNTIQRADASQIIPKMVADKLALMGQHYGIKLDVQSLNLRDITPNAISEIRAKIDILTANAKLLPELMKLTQKLMKADIKLAEFHRDITNLGIQHQTKIDKVTADTWLGMVGYNSKASRLEHRTNVRTQLIEHRDNLYAAHQNDTIAAAERAIADAEYQVMSSNRQILAESRQAQIKGNGEVFAANQERKQRLNEYVKSAFIGVA